MINQTYVELNKEIEKIEKRYLLNNLILDENIKKSMKDFNLKFNKTNLLKKTN
jgi:hypothetical protein